MTADPQLWGDRRRTEQVCLGPHVIHDLAADKWYDLTFAAANATTRSSTCRTRLSGNADDALFRNAFPPARWLDARLLGRQ